VFTSPQPEDDVDLDLVLDLMVNLVAIGVLAYGLYFRRHRRRDLVLALIALNTSLFLVTATLATSALDLGVGFGLFAVLSLVRLRSETSTQEEIGYYFVALVLGLLNGVRAFDLGATLVLNLLVLVIMFVADHPRVLHRYERLRVVLDVAEPDPARLRADLEARLDGTVAHLVVGDIDFVRDTTSCDVRLRRHPSPGWRSPAPAGWTTRAPAGAGR
jgi:hypothetical protein